MFIPVFLFIVYSLNDDVIDDEIFPFYFEKNTEFCIDLTYTTLIFKFYTFIAYLNFVRAFFYD